ncbi:hypothetical protein BO83DRAFT_122239 [Aspergillus eucalypticola CBS 122712]|uniref:Uncharacterized protein n=1 Tax=Aspergillus eucalypticola (strain CBS 122712 / IBT 29274) TaxID=1448314 RepID=A0A317UVQ0_ASPEC|nr:uncharacterized protein BO83DRAFT_122239 [Aspergillus eucalypticola CBS 122712]PWY65108.1 hypothetical protein BO83DRAFT_122239 [Aspergillus eucalypticola CBS 122712]
MSFAGYLIYCSHRSLIHPLFISKGGGGKSACIFFSRCVMLCTSLKLSCLGTCSRCWLPRVEEKDDKDDSWFGKMEGKQLNPPGPHVARHLHRQGTAEIQASSAFRMTESSFCLCHLLKVERNRAIRHASGKKRSGECERVVVLLSSRCSFIHDI